MDMNEELLRAIRGLASDISELKAVMLQRLEGIDQRLDGIDQRLEGIDQRLDHHSLLLGQHSELLAEILKRLDEHEALLKLHTQLINQLIELVIKQGIALEKLERITAGMLAHQETLADSVKLLSSNMALHHQRLLSIEGKLDVIPSLMKRLANLEKQLFGMENPQNLT